MILDVSNLTVSKISKEETSKQNIQILKDVSFQIEEDSCLGILGESGSGKSMTWKTIMGLLDPSFKVEGTVNFKGQSLLDLSNRDMRDIRGRDVGIVVQNPMTAFNPLYTIQNQMVETLRAHKKLKKREAVDIACSVLARMKFQNVKSVMAKYPHELSGGMLQRVMIALALSLEPTLIIADEPTTAIDSITQLEVLKELSLVREKFGVSMLFVSHDLGVVERIADNIIVMAGGRVVERGHAWEIMSSPQNIHTKKLVKTRAAMLNAFYEKVKGESAYAAGS